MTTIERRFAAAESGIEKNTLTGYASVYGTYADLSSYLETFAPTAFDAVLADPATDVRSFWNHESGMLLGRQSAGTVRVWSDSTGLGYEVSLPKTSYANDIRELAERGDIGGVSIGFRPDQESWSALSGRELRTHISVAALIELSPCSLPAYGSTTVQLRSLADIPQPDGNAVRSQTALARARVHLPRGNN